MKQNKNLKLKDKNETNGKLKHVFMRGNNKYCYKFASSNHQIDHNNDDCLPEA